MISEPSSQYGLGTDFHSNPVDLCREKKTHLHKGFLWVPCGLLIVHWMAQGMARARNTFCTS